MSIRSRPVVGLIPEVDSAMEARAKATTLIREGVELVTLAELLGHVGLDMVRAYPQPTEEVAP